MRFRDGAWRDPERTMLGSGQEAWLGRRVQALGGAGDSLADARPADGDGRPGRFRPRRGPGFEPTRPTEVKRVTAIGAAASEVGLPLNLDAWDGYPAARDRLLRSALDADANLARPLRRQPQRLGLRPRPRRHPRRGGVRRAERHLAGPRSLCAGSRPGRGGAGPARPQPGAEMGRASSAAAI